MNTRTAPLPSAPAMKAADLGTNWANKNTQIKFVGTEITLPALPEPMDFDVAIETIERVKEQESQQFEVKEVVTGAPWDALYALFEACQEIYGVVTSHSIQTWFGEIKPEYVTIKTGPGDTDKIQVPKGLMKVPGVKSDFYLDFAGTKGAVLYGTVNRRDQSRLIDIANKAREIIKTRSIYKGKAFTIKVDGDGDLDMNQQPVFLPDMDRVSESDIIHTQKTARQIRYNIWAPLKNTEACRKHNIPLKRGILLSGKYGTGKSMTARVSAKVATDNGWTMINLDRSLGLKSAIEFAQAYQPCVIFAEDGDRNADRSEESVNDLVNLIDGMVSKTSEMMIVLTTNHIEKIDKALLRPGRFDAIINIDAPDFETTVRIINLYARELLSPDQDLTTVATTISNNQWTPADIREIVERSKLAMLSEDRTILTSDDLEAIAENMVDHLKLLHDETEAETDHEKFITGFKAIVREAGFESSEIDIDLDGQTRALKTHINSVHNDLASRTLDVKKAAVAAAGKAAEVKEDTDKIKRAVKA